LHISSGGLLIDSYIPNAPASGTSGFIADYVSNVTRFWSRGDATTRGSFAFKTLENDGGNQIDAMVIDSSGNVLVGTTNTLPAINNVEGIALSAGSYGGRLEVSRAGNEAVSINRKTNDGSLMSFKKDGTTVGSIGVNDDKIIFGTANAALAIDQSSNIILPYNPATPGTRDAAIDLGYGSGRFKDLYLSGGAYLGGAVAANKLDDYEEGTWTPGITGASSAPTITYLNNGGTYTKIGNTVTLFFGTRIDGISGGSGVVRITGLPFAAGSYGAFQNPAGIATAQVLTTSQEGPVLFYAEDNAATLQGRLLNDNADTIMNLNLLQGGSYIVCTFTYQL